MTALAPRPVLLAFVAPGAVVFLLSDFQDPDFERTLRVVARKHDVVAIAVDDPRELHLPDVGLVAVEDPETGTPLLLDTGSRRVRAAYAARAQHRRRASREALARTGVDLLELSTAEPVERPLVRFFRERARRAARA